MFKKLFKGIFTIFGALLGYEAFYLFRTFTEKQAGENAEYIQMTGVEEISADAEPAEAQERSPFAPGPPGRNKKK